MSVVITLEAEAKEGQLDTLKNMFIETLPDTRNFNGCNSVATYVDQNKANTVFMIENWESPQHYEKYIAWRTEKGDMEMLGAMLAGPPTIRFFNAFDS